MDINSYKYNKKKDKLKSSKTNSNSSFIKNYILDFISRIMVCIVIVLLCLIMIKMNSSYKNKIHEYVYEKNFNFSYFQNLYNKYLGGVFPIDSFISVEKVFNEKLSYNNISDYNDGCKIDVNNNYLVPGLESGIVVYIGDKDDYGRVVIIQQNNGIDVWYGNVESSLSMYDYVEKGELIGEAKSDYIYLVFEKEGEYLNYKDYI